MLVFLDLYMFHLKVCMVADTNSELDEDNSQKLPITAYAKTKWAAECELKK